VLIFFVIVKYKILSSKQQNIMFLLTGFLPLVCKNYKLNMKEACPNWPALICSGKDSLGAINKARQKLFLFPFINILEYS